MKVHSPNGDTDLFEIIDGVLLGDTQAPYLFIIDDIALLENTPTQAESLLHSPEQAVGGIGFHVNADKTEYMCFNKKKETSSL